MVQKIFGLGVGGTGIVSTLIIAGIFLKVFDINQWASDIAISGGLGIGIILGLLGIFAVAKRVIG